MWTAVVAASMLVVTACSSSTPATNTVSAATSGAGASSSAAPAASSSAAGASSSAAAGSSGAAGASSSAAPAGSSSAPAVDDGSWKGKSVTIWAQAKPDVMSPLGSSTQGNDEVVKVLQDTLAAAGNDGSLIPRLATKWEQAPDAKSFTVTLADQKWSDGTPLTPDDVLFTFNTYANPAVKAPLGSQLTPIEGYDAVKAGTAKTLSGLTKVGTDQVKFTLTSPDSGFMFLVLAGLYYILPEHALKDVDPSTLLSSPLWAKPGGVPGLGPFVMTANLPGQRVEFKRNPNFRTPAHFETLIESLVTQDVATQQLSSGEMDATLVAPTDVASAQGFSGVTLSKNDSPGFDRYTVNIRKPYLQNKLVRQAFLTAIDRAGIIASIYSGQASPDNTSFLAKGVDTSGLDTYAYDPAKAKDLLKQANWDPNQPIQIVEANNNAQRASVDQVVLKNLQDIGVKATIKVIDQAQVTATLAGDYDIFLYGGGNYIVDPVVDVPILSCATIFPAGANLPGYCNKDLDALFDKAKATADPKERMDFFSQAAKIENADVPMLWIARPQRTYALSSKITGGFAGGEGMSNAVISIADWTVK